ncbi:MAG: FIST C-terminal domain-containing protein [Planctomycetales bacterium]|nr:FIST C-terminal domain-containing protein [Planctomycetales bacterium]
MQSTNPILCGAGLSTKGNADAAIEEACSEAAKSFAGRTPDLAAVFVSPHHVDALDRIVAAVHQRLAPTALIGCTGESIVGGAREIEEEPAVSLWAASLPGATIRPMHLQFVRTLDGGSIVGWADALAGDWPRGAAMLVLGDPFTFPAEMLLEQMNQERPEVPVFGGMASGFASPGRIRLALGDRVLHDGAVAVVIDGPLTIRGVTSQGCRPIGRPMIVTKAEQNVIYELGGRPALAQARELFASLPTRDQQLANRGLHVGRVMSEYRDHFEQGDFLIKNVIGVDPAAQAIAIGDYVRVGQTVQFHVRDAASADAELQALLARARSESAAPPAGALLFTCNGRGTRLFDVPDHDAAAVQAALGPLPLAGFFAQGEIGPVGGQNFIHGFTASVALFASA